MDLTLQEGSEDNLLQTLLLQTFMTHLCGSNADKAALCCDHIGSLNQCCNGIQARLTNAE